MPKFKVIKEGVNEELIAKTHDVVKKYLNELFHDYEIVHLDDTYSFTFGTVTVNIRVIGWHTDDVLVEVYAYLAEEIILSNELAEELLSLNASTHFGSFGITFDKSIVYSYSLAGAHLDMNEFTAAVQTVATMADSYDEMIQARKANQPV
ncbi:MAG: YbjN domain-containing protein [Thermonemataceae bacterium]